MNDTDKNNITSKAKSVKNLKMNIRENNVIIFFNTEVAPKKATINTINSTLFK